MLSREIAKKIAVDICYTLQPFCDRINIAGSIRREKWEVKDIEIICQPKRVPAGQVDIFTNVATKKQVHPGFANAFKKIGKIVKGKPDGRQMQVEVLNLYGGVRMIMVDIFMPQDHDYFRHYAMRTGSAEYTRNNIANTWIRKGWVGTEDGLRLEIQCVGSKTPEGKVKWKCITNDPTLPPVWQSEKEFFEWLGVNYIHPKYRTI